MTSAERLAGCDYFKGQISEVVVHNEVGTDEEGSTIDNYLRQRVTLAPNVTPAQ